MPLTCNASLCRELAQAGAARRSHLSRSGKALLRGNERGDCRLSSRERQGEILLAGVLALQFWHSRFKQNLRDGSKLFAGFQQTLTHGCFPPRQGCPCDLGRIAEIAAGQDRPTS